MKNVLITGGLGDLAQDIVNNSPDGYSYILLDVLEKTSEPPSNVLGYIHSDITNGVSLEQAIEKFLSPQNIKIDGIVNTPAWHDFKSFEETNYGNMQKAVDVKLLGYANSIKASLQHLNAGASIVNIASVHAHATYSGYAMYAAANGGVISLTRALTVEFKNKYRFNTITPGGFLTKKYMEVVDNWQEKKEKRQVLLSNEISNIVYFLLSEESSGLNGTELIADVGSSAMRSSSSQW